MLLNAALFRFCYLLKILCFITGNDTYLLCTQVKTLTLKHRLVFLNCAGGSSEEDDEDEGDEPLLAIEKRAKILDRKR